MRSSKVILHDMAASKEVLAQLSRKCRKQIPEPLKVLIHDMEISIMDYIKHPLYKKDFTIRLVN